MRICLLRDAFVARFPISIILPSLFILLFILLSPQNVFSFDITLAWDTNIVADLAGFRVFYHDSNNNYDYSNPEWEGNVRTCTLYNLQNGTNYYFVARAFSTKGEESVNSNEVIYPPLVNDPPVAEANGPYSGTEGQAIDFSSAGSGDVNGDSITYNWSFGDGTTSTGANPVHTYAHDGIYTLTLTVSDGSLTDSESVTVTVTDMNPVAGFSGTPITGSAPLAVNFTASVGSYDGIATYSWDFGDGYTGTGATASHTYTTSGIYTVSLNVTETDGDTATETRTGYITVNQAKVLPTLTGLSISGEDVLDENSFSNYTATAMFSDGNTQIVTDIVSWSEDSLYADINSTGELTASEVTTDQIVTITAIYNFDGMIETAEKVVMIIDISESTPIPFKPVITSPLDGQIDCELMVQLKTLPFTDPNANTHSHSQWQISRQEDFSSLILDITSDEHLTEFTVPCLVLGPETTYYVRVRFFDIYFEPSEWSDIIEFTTILNHNDANENGLPDDQEISFDIDLNEDGIADNKQPDIIKSVQSTSRSDIIAVSKDSDSIVSIEAMKAIDPSTILETRKKPRKILLFLFAYRLRLSKPGITIFQRIYFSNNIRMAKGLYKYDTVHGWEDYSQYVTFDYETNSIIIELKDGANGDSDGVANGIIVDPGGLVEDDFASPFDDGSPRGGCFIEIIGSDSQ